MIKAQPEEGSRYKGKREEEGFDVVQLLKKTAEKKKRWCGTMKIEIFKLMTVGNVQC